MKVNGRAKAFKKLDCNFVEKKEPYSKSTVPHFMENDDEEKYIVNGMLYLVTAFVCMYIAIHIIFLFKFNLPFFINLVAMHNPLTTDILQSKFSTDILQMSDFFR